MRTQENRRPPSPQFQQQVFHLAGSDGVKAGGRFVKNQEFRIVDQSLSQPKATTHALGIFTDGPTLDLRQPDHVEKLVNSTGSGSTIESENSSVVVERLLRIEVAVQIRLFWEIADPPLDRDVRRLSVEHAQSSR